MPVLLSLRFFGKSGFPTLAVEHSGDAPCRPGRGETIVAPAFMPGKGRKVFGPRQGSNRPSLQPENRHGSHLHRSAHHIIFSTRAREPILTCDARSVLFPYMAGIIAGQGGKALIVNGVSDHAHILCRLRS